MFFQRTRDQPCWHRKNDVLEANCASIFISRSRDKSWLLNAFISSDRSSPQRDLNVMLHPRGGASWIAYSSVSVARFWSASSRIHSLTCLGTSESTRHTSAGRVRQGLPAPPPASSPEDSSTYPLHRWQSKKTHCEGRFHECDRFTLHWAQDGARFDLHVATLDAQSSLRAPMPTMRGGGLRRSFIGRSMAAS